MTTNPAISDSGRSLFPEFWEVGGSIHAETASLTDAQLDWTSDRWEWAEWSVRRQVSHMASMLYRWLLVRWGSQLFPGGAGLDETQLRSLADSRTDRALDEDLFTRMEDIARALDNGLALAQGVLESHSVDEMRRLTIQSRQGTHWDLMIQAHPTGIDRDPATGVSTLTLEGTFRHMYYELVTHLFNVQRLKRAQGLLTVVELPRVGYWTLEGWDVSEA